MLRSRKIRGHLHAGGLLLSLERRPPAGFLRVCDLILQEETMSKRINVNPGQYKVAGRERQGEDIVHEDQKRLMNEREKEHGPGSPNFIPGALPLGVSPKDLETEDTEKTSKKPR